MIDFTPAGKAEGAPLYARNPGGAPLNMLVQASRLGCSCAFLGKVGADAFGYALRDVMTANGIDTAGLRFSENTRTTLAFVHLSDDGERSFSFYRNPGADLMLESGEVDTDVIRKSRVFSFGSLSLTAEPVRSATAFALEQAKTAGCLVAFDPNYREGLWDGRKNAVCRILEYMPYADILKISEEELLLLTDTEDPERGSELLAGRYGISLVCVSLGEGGAFFLCGEKKGTVPGYRVNAVDTTGAGDAFLGALLSRLKGYSPAEIRGMDREEIISAVRFANAAGALAVTGKGAIPAIRERREIEKFLEEHGN